MEYLVGVLVLVVGVLVSIALHEVGHMVPAKRFGVRVSHYMVGFGPTLWSRVRGETEYGLKAIPLGGFVRLVGMYPPAESVGNPSQRGFFGRVAADAREVSAAEILPGEDARAFYRLSTPKKLVVMLGGPFMNLLIAIGLFAVLLSGFGLPTSSTTLDAVSTCVIPVSEDADRTCTPDDTPAPAAAAGLRPGDRVVSFDGVAVEEWTQLQALIRASGGEEVELVLERDGERVTTSITPITAERPVLDDEGQIVLGPDGEARTTQVGFLGMTPASELVRQPLSAAPAFVADATWRTFGVIANLPSHVAGLAESAFTSEPRDREGLVGVVGIGRFAGEIAANEEYSATEQFQSLLSLIASLNIALFAFNLIPLLPLDGGHVVGALWEGARRQVARLRGLPRPGPFDTARLVPLAYGVFVLLAGLGLLLVYADLFKPITLG
ncbi:M50 family metallopeptidase [Cellulomonas sp. NS3]|uniref:M50 family metallopeptidase n=1 Tax=Cellulomonas sp. NS3 TaxID=2973977 RepID=UPI002161DB02|nr:site-2 protease family protein [Cellulomonas sp. NS3]